MLLNSINSKAMNVLNFLRRKTTWANTELAWVKVCVASTYLILGTYFHTFFVNYLPIIWCVFLITMAWALYLWLKKMSSAKQ